MKVISPCPKCTIPPGAGVMMSGELDSNLLAICSCPNGHRYIVHQAHSAPEVIYSAGARAFIAGFYSESVLTLTAALERGYELFVKVFLLASGKRASDIDAFWKPLESSSERQLGAFSSTYFYVTGDPWKVPRTQTEFRNKVAHKGYIATRREAHDYGEYATSSLNRIMSYIKTHHLDMFYKHLETSRETVYGKAEEMRRIDPLLELSFAGSSAIEWNNLGHPQPTFDGMLAVASALANQLEC